MDRQYPDSDQPGGTGDERAPADEPARPDGAASVPAAETEPGAEAEAPGPPVCATCGAVAAGMPVTWTCSVEHGVRRYICEDCSRTHLRAIEGRLDSDWW